MLLLLLLPTNGLIKVLLVDRHRLKQCSVVSLFRDKLLVHLGRDQPLPLHVIADSQSFLVRCQKWEFTAHLTSTQAFLFSSLASVDKLLFSVWKVVCGSPGSQVKVLFQTLLDKTCNEWIQPWTHFWWSWSSYILFSFTGYLNTH